MVERGIITRKKIFVKSTGKSLECDRVSENKGLPVFSLEGLWVSQDGLQEDRVCFQESW